MKHRLGAKYYYRYVDDFIILHPSHEFLNHCFQSTSEFLQQELKISLHPFKKRLGLVRQGVDFVGYVHKPHHRLARIRTIHKAKSVVHQWKKNPRGLEPENMERFRASYNAYMGIIRWGATYNFRKKMGDQVNSLFVFPSEDYSKLILP